MALKTNLETQDKDTSLVDIPLFATADEAVKDIHLDNSGITVKVVKDEDLEK